MKICFLVHRGLWFRFCLKTSQIQTRKTVSESNVTLSVIFKEGINLDSNSCCPWHHICLYFPERPSPPTDPVCQPPESKRSKPNEAWFWRNSGLKLGKNKLVLAYKNIYKLLQWMWHHNAVALCSCNVLWWNRTSSPSHFYLCTFYIIQWTRVFSDLTLRC